MKTYLILAWRNLSRNKRRTIITGASIFFAMFFALLMRSFQLGSYDNMINNVVENYSGYIQIHQKGYWNDKTIENSFEYAQSLEKNINNLENIKITVPKFEYAALSSYKEQTKIALIVGVDPIKEQKMSKLDKRIVKYRFTPKSFESMMDLGISKDAIDAIKLSRKYAFTSKEKLYHFFEKTWDKKTINTFAEKTEKIIKIEGNYIDKTNNGILIGERLAAYLNITVGDTMVIFGQGYHAVTAAGLFPVAGIIKLPNPNMDNKFIYMNITDCQQLFGATNRLTTLAINLNNPKKMLDTYQNLSQIVDTSQYELMHWKEINKELVQQIDSDNASGIIMLGILYVIIGFGVLGTVLMMTAERKKEFGVMIALGMKKTQIVFVVFLELLFLSIIGVFSGIVISLPIIRYMVVNPVELSGEMAQMMENFGVEPIMPLAWEFSYFANQFVAINIIVLIAVIYPLLAIGNIKVNKALRA